jgi:hypothetical protein
VYVIYWNIPIGYTHILHRIRCNIMGTAQDGTVLGFISPFWEGGMGQYGTFQPLPLGTWVVYRSPEAGN